MNSNTTNLLKIEDNWIKNGSNPETKPSILDLRALFEGDKNKILSELRGIKSARFAKDYDEFSNKVEMISNEPAFSSISFNLRRTTPAQEDVFRNQFIAIKEVSPKLYYDLIKVVINQYGIHHTTSDSFSKFIPEEDTRKIMRDKYDAFNRLTDADQIRLLNQFKDQFMQRSIQFTPDVKKTKKTTKAGVEYAVREDDGKSKLPHLVMTSKNADGKMVTNFIKPTIDVYKDTTTYRYSDRAGEGNRYPKVYSDVGSKAIIRGHGRFFLGYDLSLNDKNSGVSKQSGIIFNDNQGEINMMMNEVNEIRSGINFQEEQSSGYVERTKKNASADATIHLGIDFTTAGEKLTKSSVQNQGKQYISLDVNNFSITPERVDKIVDMLNSVNAKTLNIAGNGIYTMKGKYTQQQVDDFTYDLLNQVLNSPKLTNKIVSIRSGGQTGFDEAGAKAGIKLGIPTLVLAPKGWAFRPINNIDISTATTKDAEQQFKARFNSVKPTINNNQYYTGDIKPEKDVIFVFGSNPEGRHGAGAAKVAKDKFGAIYGQGEGLQGNSYALPTKDLRIKENNGFKSISPTQITDNIKKLYQIAQANPGKQFKIGYRNTTDKSLNGYTGLEMIDMFNNAGTIPSNIIFSKEWFDTGKLNINKPTINQPVSQAYQNVSKNEVNEMNSNPLIQAGIKPTDMGGNASKDIQMASESNQFIGFGTIMKEGNTSSTDKYVKAWGDNANTGNYNSSDIIMVSASGNFGRGGVDKQLEANAIRNTFDTKYKPLLDKAIEAGSSFRVGNQYSKGNLGDELVAKYLLDNNYNYDNLTGYTRWTKSSDIDTGNNVLFSLSSIDQSKMTSDAKKKADDDFNEQKKAECNK